jgi:hypothetical protein
MTAGIMCSGFIVGSLYCFFKDLYDHQEWKAMVIVSGVIIMILLAGIGSIGLINQSTPSQPTPSIERSDK